MTKDFDVVIIGGGPAGAVAARELAKNGRRVALLDKQKERSRQRIGESLPPAARPLLRRLGLLELMNCDAHRPAFANFSSWGHGALDVHDFLQDPNGHGWHLDRVRFDADLVKAALDQGVVLITREVSRVEEKELEFVVSISGGESLKARWLIDASGRSAAFARKLGAVRVRDDRLMAIYAWVQPSSRDRDARTLIETCADGWWYSSRLPDSSRLFSLHTDRALVKEGLDGKWLESLRGTRHLKSLVPRKFSPELHVVEAGGSRLSQFGGKRWLAAGDAALAFDPLSSQGLFNALYSGMKVSELILKELAGEISTEEVVEQYSSRLEEIRAIYLARQTLYYGSEKRWEDSQFWNEQNRNLKAVAI